jgi:hypothetical protein
LQRTFKVLGTHSKYFSSNLKLFGVSEFAHVGIFSVAVFPSGGCAFQPASKCKFDFQKNVFVFTLVERPIDLRSTRLGVDPGGSGISRFRRAVYEKRADGLYYMPQYMFNAFTHAEDFKLLFTGQRLVCVLSSQSPGYISCSLPHLLYFSQEFGFPKN